MAGSPLLEVIGSKNTAEQAFRMLAPGGAATLVGMIPFGTKIELHGAISWGSDASRAL